MAGFFDRPVMAELSTAEMLKGDMAEAVGRAVKRHRRELLAYRMRVIAATALAWFLIYVFCVGAMNVFGVGKLH